MLPILFSIGPVHIYSYGLMIAIGILIAYSLVERKFRKFGLENGRLEWLFFSVIGGGFLGSKLLYWITRLPDIPNDPTILTNLGDGWVVYGGIIGGFIAGWVYCKNHGMDFWRIFDLVIPNVALAQGFGRIGCFLAGCCYGVEMESFGIVFPVNSLAPSGVSLFPSQLIMSAFDFGLFFFLEWFTSKKKFKGEVGAIYLLAYSFGRFIIEFFRGDLVRGVVNGLSTSQYISILTAIVGIAVIFVGRKRSKENHES
ncbi:prolipoprotein diacylglyceryl transferase [Allobaculum stercoricanis]|uniref:prolipoprotein diacylglyceryl transferase n=1 Tax=Allobaculum stercoricanis TaxID=174709 RepID=UPI000371BF94|nr:prolipoprotein diacylglyceryl transferase [Allobaculum stercoricanis]